MEACVGFCTIVGLVFFVIGIRGIVNLKVTILHRQTNRPAIVLTGIPAYIYCAFLIAWGVAFLAFSLFILFGSSPHSG